MAKLQPDYINWVVSLNATELQKEIHNIKEKSRDLKDQNKQLKESMKELVMQGKYQSDAYKQLDAQVKKNNTTISQNNEKIKQCEARMNNANKSFAQLTKEARFLQRQLDNTSKALAPQEYARLETQLNETKAAMANLRGATEQTKSSFFSMSKMKASVVGFFAGIGAGVSNAIYNFVQNSSDFINQSISMSSAADGVRHAFERLNKPGLLDNLKESTKGTVSEFNLMKAAVRADFFKIPLENLGTLLKFAQKRAQDTGQSVDYMAESIVTGLGRKSVKILDNLGLSAAEINEEVEKTGDFMKGVSNIIERELSKSTDDYTAAAAKAAQRTAAMEDRMVKLGNALRPIKGQYNTIKQSMKIFFADTAIWIAEHKDAIITVISVLTGWWAVMKTLMILQKTWTGIIMIAKSANIAYAGVMLLLEGNAARSAAAIRVLNSLIVKNSILSKAGAGAAYLFAAAKALLTGNLVKAKTAMSAFNAIIKINPWVMAATAVTALGVAIYALTKKTDTQKAIQEDLNDVETETQKKLSDHKTKIDLLLGAIHNENASNEDRYKAIKKLQKIVPGYNAEISNTGKITKENTKAIKQYIEQLEKQMRLEAIKDKLTELYREQFDAEDKVKRKKVQLDTKEKVSGNVVNSSSVGSTGIAAVMIAGAEVEYSKAKEKLTSINDRITALKNKLKDNFTVNDIIKNNEEDEPDQGSGGGATEDPKITKIKKALDNEKALYVQHQIDLKNLYISGKDGQLNSQEAFNEAMEQLSMSYLQRSLEIVGTDSEQGKEIQQQLLDFKLKCLEEYYKDKERMDKEAMDKQKDLDEKTRKASEESIKQKEKEAEARVAAEQKVTDMISERLNKSVDQYKQYGDQIGVALGNIFTGQQDALEAFGGTMIDILFDVLTQIVNQKIIEAAAVAVAEQAKATAVATALPDSVATFGAASVPRIAIISGLIMAGLAAAKTALKGLISKGKKSSSSDTGTSTVSPSATRVVKGYSEGGYTGTGGRYEIAGAVHRGEYVVPAPEMMNPKVIDSVRVIESIRQQRTAVNPLPGFAEGGYTGYPTNQNNLVDIESLKQILKEIKDAISDPNNPRKNYVLLSDVNKATELKNKAEKPFTRGDRK